MIRRRNDRQGGLGMIMLLIVLAIVGYLVFLQVKDKGLPTARDLGGLPKGMVDPHVIEDVQTAPGRTIEHFKDQVEQINQQQQDRLNQ